MSETNPSREALLADDMALPERLATAVGRLSQEEIDQTGGPGEWSIRQIVHHLGDGQTVWTVCMRVAIGTPGTAMQFPFIRATMPGPGVWLTP